MHGPYRKFKGIERGRRTACRSRRAQTIRNVYNWDYLWLLCLKTSKKWLYYLWLVNWDHNGILHCVLKINSIRLWIILSLFNFLNCEAFSYVWFGLHYILMQSFFINRIFLCFIFNQWKIFIHEKIKNKKIVVLSRS